MRISVFPKKSYGKRSMRIAFLKFKKNIRKKK